MAENIETLSETATYEALEAYPWHEDAEFQSGLSSILSTSNGSPSDAESGDLILRARCFYFSRKTNTYIDLESYKIWRAKEASSPITSSAPANGAAHNGQSTQALNTGPLPDNNAAASTSSVVQEETSQPGYPASFDDIIELIKSGKPVPGIKEIPNIVLSGQGTEAREGRRLKPWEKASETTREVEGKSNTLNI